MAKKCHYPKNAKTLEELASIFDDFLKGSWSPLIEGGITADNLSQSLFSPSLSGSPGGGASGGASLAPVPGSNGPSRVLSIPLLHRDGPGTIRQKMSGNKAVGVEMLVDPASGADGRLCLVDWKDTAKRQVVSLAIDGDDGEIVANEGDLNVNADGEVNIQGIGSKGYIPRTVKFSNGTLLRSLNTASYTLNNLADILYTLAYDIKASGLLSGWTATASATYTFDLASFTANTLASFMATVINDIQTNGYLSVSLYRCTTPRGRFALDCDSFTMNQLGQAVCAFMAELGVSGLEIGLATKQPLSTDLTAIAALTSAADKAIYATGAGAWATTTLTSFGRTLIDDADADNARNTLGLGEWAVYSLTDEVYSTGLISTKRRAQTNASWQPNDTDIYSSGDWLDNGHIFVDASSLGGSGMATLSLPEAASVAPGETLSVSIKVPGSGSDYLEIVGDADFVNGSTYTMDATVYSFATFRTDGSNWFRVG